MSELSDNSYPFNNDAPCARIRTWRWEHYYCPYCCDSLGIRTTINWIYRKQVLFLGSGNSDYQEYAAISCWRCKKRFWRSAQHKEKAYQNWIKWFECCPKDPDMCQTDIIYDDDLSCAQGLREIPEELHNKELWELFLDEFKDYGAHFHGESDLVLEVRPSKEGQDWLWVARPTGTQDEDTVKNTMCEEMLLQVKAAWKKRRIEKLKTSHEKT